MLDLHFTTLKETFEQNFISFLGEILAVPVGIVFGEATYRVYLQLKDFITRKPRVKRRGHFDGFLVGYLGVSIPVFAYTRHVEVTLGTAIVWASARIAGGSNQRLKGDDEFISKSDILDCLDQNELGVGLAFSYRQGFLRHLFFKAENFEYLDAIDRYESSYGVKFYCRQFLILLPKTCSLPDDFTSPRIQKPAGDLEIRIAPQLHRAINRLSLSVSVYRVWDANYENDYLLAFEMPHILKSALKKQGDLQDSDLAMGVRESNIKKFRSTLKKLLKSHAEARDAVSLPYRFIKFDDNEWKTEDYSSHLADVIINKLKSETETSLSESEDEG